jgi:hypothetical protein
MQIIKHSLLVGLTSIAALSGAKAQTATTDPVGFVTTTIKGVTTPGVAVTTPISPVLVVASGIDGSTVGAITGVTSNSVSLTSANWTASQLPTSLAYVMFKSGALEGLVLRVTANTSTTATLDTLSADLTTLGALVGDQIQLVQGDTVLSMFGTTVDGVVGGTQAQFTAGQTDKVTTRDASGATRTYWYNTGVTPNRWSRVGSSTDQGSTPISPLSAVFYSRIGATAINQLSTGNVPVTSVKYLVPQNGITYFSRFFPTDGTINSYGFQSLPGWKGTNTPGVTISTADKVVTTDSTGTVRQYYWTGTQWRRAGSSTDQSTTPVPIGGGVYVTRSGTVGSPAQLLNIPLPYAL